MLLSVEVQDLPQSNRHWHDALFASFAITHGVEEVIEVEVIPAQTPTLQPGETFDLEVLIEVPAEGPGLVEIVVSALSDLDGATRGYATISAARVKLGDLDGDGHVTVNDFLLLLAAWGPCPAPCPPSCPGDLDGDCAVGVLDFLLLLAEWG